ncbi:MAG: hypothetical protein LIO87_03180 [Eubacterium sp.]|nr:hypothetical protein [Eubacterium sp.]
MISQLSRGIYEALDTDIPFDGMWTQNKLDRPSVTVAVVPVGLEKVNALLRFVSLDVQISYFCSSEYDFEDEARAVIADWSLKLSEEIKADMGEGERPLYVCLDDLKSDVYEDGVAVIIGRLEIDMLVEDVEALNAEYMEILELQLAVSMDDLG